ncbi:alpha/beta fold hydrolase [Nocardioides sp.]|uniref:alpha/beta fold hydrolase n=1 Tax=Nocardioides sp. TaxID=35761 RepID=UPI003D0E7C5C
MTTPSRIPAEPAVSEEQFVTVSDGVQICYQTFGTPEDEAVLLVMGLGGPMTWWDPGFCKLLASKGFFVIRYDNRDTGRSTKLKQHHVTKAHVLRAFAGRPVSAPYSLGRMGEDGLAILDQLGIEKAHVCGISMGGMIAQTLAVEHPERVQSLVSIMSTTGSRRVGWQDPKLMPALLAPRKGGREVYMANSAGFWKKISSPGYPESPQHALDRAAVTWDRGFSATGVVRHMLAVLTQPNRTQALGAVSAPSAVIHGLSDRMVHVSGGRATAKALRGSELVLIPGMGHDVPDALFEQITDVVRRTADRSR